MLKWDLNRGAAVMHIVWLAVSLGRLQATLGYFLASSWDLFTVLSVPSGKMEAVLQAKSIIASSMSFRSDVYGNCLNDITVMSSM